MSKKLSDRLHSFPKEYELSKEAKLKIEYAINEEIINMEEQKKRLGFKHVIKKITLPVSSAIVVALAILFFVSSGENLLQKTPPVDEASSVVEEHEREVADKEIVALATIWGNALKTRDGKPRYDMMSDKAKEKFIQEQMIRSGESWNYHIGVSSPWVVDFEIDINDLNAVITYETQTSEPASYLTKESLTFVKENGKFVVDDYRIIFENRPLEDEAQFIDGDEQVTEQMHRVISDYIIAQHKEMGHQQTDIQFEVHKVYGTMQENDIITVYLWSFYNSFNRATGSEVVSGTSIPTTVISLRPSGESYEVVDYLIPKDGSESYSSIKEMFPEKYLDNTMQNTSNIEDLHSEMNEKVKQWLESPS